MKGQVANFPQTLVFALAVAFFTGIIFILVPAVLTFGEETVELMRETQEASIAQIIAKDSSVTVEPFVLDEAKLDSKLDLGYLHCAGDESDCITALEAGEYRVKITRLVATGLTNEYKTWSWGDSRIPLDRKLMANMRTDEGMDIAFLEVGLR